MNSDDLTDDVINRMAMFAAGCDLSIDLTQAELDLLEKRQPIAAIKSVRARTNCSLREAKEAVRVMTSKKFRDGFHCNLCKLSASQALIHIKTEAGAALGQDLSTQELRAVLKEILRTCNQTELG